MPLREWDGWRCGKYGQTQMQSGCLTIIKETRGRLSSSWPPPEAGFIDSISLSMVVLQPPFMEQGDPAGSPRHKFIPAGKHWRSTLQYLLITAGISYEISNIGVPKVTARYRAKTCASSTVGSRKCLLVVTTSCVVVAIELSPSVDGELGDRIRAVIFPCRLAPCHQDGGVLLDCGCCCCCCQGHSQVVPLLLLNLGTALVLFSRLSTPASLERSPAVACTMDVRM